MVLVPRFGQDEMEDSAKANAWAKLMGEQLETLNDGGRTYSIEIHEDSERHLMLPQIQIMQHGIPRVYRIGRDFLLSGEYTAIVALGEKLMGLIGSGAHVTRGERKQEIADFGEAIDWLMKESRRGYNIQRYKGLGEMNPEQLWETTMDPETRRLMQVSLEDAVAADQMFTTLMGDQVEPRREFIEQNALTVANLDV